MTEEEYRFLTSSDGVNVTIAKSITYQDFIFWKSQIIMWLNNVELQLKNKEGKE